MRVSVGCGANELTPMCCNYVPMWRNGTARRTKGDVQQAQVRRHEEGVRAVGAVRLRDRAHHLQQLEQAVPVRVDRHGQGAAQVHRVQ